MPWFFLNTINLNNQPVFLLPSAYKWMLLLLTLVTLGTAQAQSVNGIWTGTLTQEAGGCFPVYHLELQISGNGKQLKGDSYDYYDHEKYVRHHFNGMVDSSAAKILLSENELIATKIPADCIACTKTYTLQWAKAGDKETLTGSWTGHKAGNAGACPPGQITLYRSSSTAFPLDSNSTANTVLKIDSNFLQLEKRENQLFGSLKVQSPSITIDLYDNAEIDNDTVTVFMNNTMLLFRQRLTDKPLSVTVNVEKGVDYELVMYANNLGLIPPNTALMVVRAGRQKYEIRLAASDKKNASVRFRWE